MNKFNSFAPFYDNFMISTGMYKHKLIVEKLAPKKGECILDAGGGTGFIAQRIKNTGASITVLDASPKMLKRASARGLKTVVASAYEMPFDDNTFDKVICIDALHHIKEHAKTVKELHRVLKPHGTIMLIDFHRKHFSGKLVQQLEWWFVDNSVFIEPVDLEMLMDETGFVGRSEIFSTFEYYYLGKKQAL